MVLRQQEDAPQPEEGAAEAAAAAAAEAELLQQPGRARQLQDPGQDSVGPPEADPARLAPSIQSRPPSAPPLAHSRPLAPCTFLMVAA